jgi:menaquinone C8-methyltransferase
MLPHPRMGSNYVLYMHVPFCESLCPYCSFNRFIFVEEHARSYYQSLRKEMKLVSELGYSFESMYIGGGTPTILMDELLSSIDYARNLFGIKEVSCETNPNHLTPQILSSLQGRVDRLSVGVQSFNDGLLMQMNRYNRFGGGETTLRRIKEAADKIPVINVDMIFNFPRQTAEILKQDIQCVIASNANQVTFNALMASPGVGKSLEKAMGTVEYGNEEPFYQIISRDLDEHFLPVSSWTFSRKNSGLIDEYIVDYEEYLGVGPGSFSYLDGSMYANTFSFLEYNRLLNSEQTALTGFHKFNKHDRMRYRFLMDLFGLCLDKKRFKEDFGIPIEKGLPLEMAFMQTAGAFEKNDKDEITLTAKGRYLMVVMMREFFSGVNRVREHARQALTQEERALLITCDQVPLAGSANPVPQSDPGNKY